MFQAKNETPNQGEIVGARLTVRIVQTVVEVVRRGRRLIKQWCDGEDICGREDQPNEVSLRRKHLHLEPLERYRNIE